MKQLVIIFLFSLGAVISSHAQSLKDLLFSGKLKNDSGTVIRKGEDLTGKLDTAAKKPAAIAIEKKPELQQVSQAGTQTATAVEPIANSTTTPQLSSTIHCFL